VIDELVLPGEYCNTDLVNDPLFFKQQFNLDFFLSEGSFYRSGNPGYYLGKPLLVGEYATSSGAKLVR